MERFLKLANQYIPETFRSSKAPKYFFGFFGQNAHSSTEGVVMDPYLGYLSDIAAPFELGGQEKTFR
nr:hypothetical protein [Pseudoalteromonas sp. NBT06-2]